MQLQSNYINQNPITIQLQHPKRNYNSITTTQAQLQSIYNNLKLNYNSITTTEAQLQSNYNNHNPITIQLQQP